MLFNKVLALSPLYIFLLADNFAFDTLAGEVDKILAISEFEK